MNFFAGVGRLTRDPEVKITGSGKTVTKFTIAINRRFDRDKADFIKVECWGKLAEIVGKYTTKGSQVAITGELHIEEYESKWYTSITADTVEFVGNKTATPYAEKEQTTGTAFEDDINADDIPF